MDSSLLSMAEILCCCLMVSYCLHGWSYVFYCLFSYPSLLDLHYGGRIRKSQTAREQARETGLSGREAEWRIDTELFLDRYPRWKLGAPHWSVILHKMFLHAVKWGQKEAERLICQGCQGSASGPNLEVGPVCHGTSGIPYLLQGDWGHLPQCLFVEKVPRSPTLWHPAERESNLQFLSP